MSYARKKGLKNALCLYAFEGHEDYERIWDDLAALPSLDIFGCDPYWRWPPRVNAEPAPHVTHYAEKVVAKTSGGPQAPGPSGSQIWIQAMRFNKGLEGEIDAACRAAAEAGVTHLAAWSFDGGSLLDTVLAEDAAAVQKSLFKAFAKIKKT
jgi:hypothetical protein